MYYTLLCIKHMFRTQLNFTMSGTLGIKLHVSALYIGHRQVVLKLIKELYKMRVGFPHTHYLLNLSCFRLGQGLFFHVMLKYCSLCSLVL